MSEHAKLVKEARWWASVDASDARQGILFALADLVDGYATACQGIEDPKTAVPELVRYAPG